MESRHRSRRLQSAFLQQPARSDRLPAFSLMGQPPQNPRLSDRPAASFMTLFQNENCWFLVARFAADGERSFADPEAWSAHLRRLGISELKTNPEPTQVATEGALLGAVLAHG